jgi:CHAT domain-containing protein/tetratricopeptide (TPR) repeat protein
MGADDHSPASLDQLVEQLTLESHPLRRHQILREARKLWQVETVVRLYHESNRRLHVNVSQADRLARAAAWISRKLGDDGARALGHRAMAHVLTIQGSHEKARQHYEQALALFEKLGRELEIGRTLSGSLQSLIYLGQYDAAMEKAQRARGIFERAGDRLRLARLDTNMGNILFRQDRFEEALELYRRAYGAFGEVGSPQDVAILLKNMATCQICLNDFRQALETYREARTYSLDHDLPLLAAGADYNIAYLYYLKGEYTRAIEMYRAARDHCHATGDTYREGLCDLDQSEMYLELNLSEEGAHMARRALGAFRQLGMSYEAAKALTNLAISSSHHGNSRLALELFRKARELFMRENNLAWMAIIELYQALVFYQERHLTDARVFCSSALAFFSASPLTGKATLCELLLARIHLDAGRPEFAKTICLRALRRLEGSETPALAYQAYFVLGSIEEALGGRDAAHAAYLQAHEQLENLRSHLKTEEVKIAFLKDKLEVYESLVRLCLEESDSETSRRSAFTYIEQAKSRSLADLIAFRANNLRASTEMHRALVEQVSGLREELNWYSRALQNQERRVSNLRDPQLEKLRRAARECEQRLVEAMANLRVQDQEFASLHAAGSIELDAIQAVLPEDAVFLQYFRVRDTFLACLLTRRTLKIVPAGSVAELRRNMQLLRFQLSKFRLGQEYVNKFHNQLLDATNAHLREFHRQLILPIEKDLRGEHLIIAPHDFLHYLPYHALLTPEGPLDARFSISYSPSASVYYLCATKNVRPSEGALVLGVPDPAAPQILDEVRAVSSVLPNAEVFIGEHATQEVLREKGARARYIHVATHGWFRQDNPMFSSISLGTSQLSLFDLYQLNLPSELVTLSGCGTGLNVVVGGDELMGLKRGLLYAGAQGALLTLWDVNDQSTAEFMKLFYGRLSSSPNKARALQSATAELRARYPHPFYWAPFVLIGKYL